MNIEITKEDILKMIHDEHSGDIKFLFEIIEAGTTSWYSHCQLIHMMIEEVKRREPGYYDDIINSLKEDTK